MDDCDNNQSECNTKSGDYIYFNVGSKSLYGEKFSYLNPPQLFNDKFSPLHPLSLFSLLSKIYVSLWLINHIALCGKDMTELLGYALGGLVIITLIELIGGNIVSKCVSIFFWVVLPQLLVIGFRGQEITLAHLLLIVGTSGSISSIIMGLVCSNVW